MKKNKKIMMTLIMLIMSFIGWFLIFSTDWKIGLGIVLVMSVNNYDQRIQFEKTMELLWQYVRGGLGNENE